MASWRMRTVISAPGKVLLAGGYLVLDQQYSGLVVSTSSRFYCSIAPLESSPSSSASGASETHASSSNSHADIVVRAGQFPASASTWNYRVCINDRAQLEVRQTNLNEVGKNKFVEVSLCKSLEAIWETISAGSKGEGAAKASGEELLRRIRGSADGVELVVLANNDFYSQREQLATKSLKPTITSLSSLEPFSPLPKAIHQTNKTGLGSSAALVTSLTAALLSHFGVIDLPSPAISEALHHQDQHPPSSSSHGLHLVHSLAQLSHCSAQGKVGSGFDISSAVYGTHTYTRFSPDLIKAFLDTSSTIELTHQLLPALSPARWDHKSSSFRLPKGLRLLLADVDAGTDTPSFVGQVLKWRAENKTSADELWGNLGKANDTLGQLLRDLAEMEGREGYDDVLSTATSTIIDKCDIANPISQYLVRIHAALTLIRSFLQHMSTLSNVPIEPPEQTRLLDACCAIPGVLGGGVPGAGGYDAIFLLVIDAPAVISAVEEVWSNWTEMSVCPLTARQSDGGLRREIIEEVPGLQEAISRGAT